MKSTIKIVYAILLMILFNVKSYSQILEINTSSIENEVAQINNELKSYSLTKSNNDSLSSTSYFSKNEIIKSIQLTNIDYHREKKELYYYTKEKLIYCEVQWIDLYTKKVVDLEKYYFVDQKMTKWLKNETIEIPSSSPNFIAAQNEIISSSNNLISEHKK